MGLGSRSGRLSRVTASRSCSEIVKFSGCATWREDQVGSPRHCGLIVGSMGSIYAEKALYGSDAVIANRAKSDRASGSESRAMRTGSCDFIFGAVRSSAVQDRFRNKQPCHGRSAPLLQGGRLRSPAYSAGDPVSLDELLDRRRTRRTFRCRPNVRWWHEGEAERGAKPVRLCPCSSDVDLLGYGESVIDLNAEIPDRALDLGMSQ